MDPDNELALRQIAKQAPLRHTRSGAGRYAPDQDGTVSIDDSQPKRGPAGMGSPTVLDDEGGSDAVDGLDDDGELGDLMSTNSYATTAMISGMCHAVGGRGNVTSVLNANPAGATAFDLPNGVDAGALNFAERLCDSDGCCPEVRRRIKSLVAADSQSELSADLQHTHFHHPLAEPDMKNEGWEHQNPNRATAFKARMTANPDGRGSTFGKIIDQLRDLHQQGLHAVSLGSGPGVDVDLDDILGDQPGWLDRLMDAANDDESGDDSATMRARSSGRVAQGFTQQALNGRRW